MQINTTAKGDHFENRVYTILQKLLTDEALFLPGKHSKILRKKAYYSKDREAEIVFDISIETYLPGATDYSLLTLIECKHYNTSVPVNDIEEFAAKVNQVGQHNTKAILIANSNFQSGAEKFSKSQKIALARVNPKDEIQWILHRKEDTTYLPRNTGPETSLLTNSDNLVSFAASFDGSFLHSLPDLLLRFGILDQWTIREDYLAVPYITYSDIDAILDRFSIGRHFHGQMLDMNNLCEHLSSIYGVDFDFTQSLERTNNSRTLGKICFSPLKIFIAKDIEDKNRFRYTLAHEIAHLLLHLYLLKPYFANRVDTDHQLEFGSPFTNQSSARLETQANMLACQLLLPTRSIVYFVLEHFQKYDIHHGYLLVDWQPCNQHAYFLLMNKIQIAYGVSKEVAKLRLIKLGLLIDTTENSIHSILQKNGFLAAFG